jgi:uncharacterized protein (TIGR01244 family)
MAAVEDIVHYRKVNDRLATAGQPTEDQLRAAAEAGFEVVINLAPDDAPNALAGEAGLVRSLGMQYVHIPVPFPAPEEQQLLAFFDAMDANAERRLLVHCAANKRVSAFLGLRGVLRRGESVEEAFALMRGLWEPNPVWAAFIQEMLTRRPGQE